MTKFGKIFENAHMFGVKFWYLIAVYSILVYQKLFIVVFYKRLSLKNHHLWYSCEPEKMPPNKKECNVPMLLTELPCVMRLLCSRDGYGSNGSNKSVSFIFMLIFIGLVGHFLCLQIFVLIENIETIFGLVDCKNEAQVYLLWTIDWFTLLIMCICVLSSIWIVKQ